jgi:hypothetical protein
METHGFFEVRLEFLNTILMNQPSKYQWSIWTTTEQSFRQANVEY